MRYQEVEEIRKKRRYIRYLFYVLDDNYKDEFNIDLFASRHNVRSLKTGILKSDITRSLLSNSSASDKNCPFYEIETFLKCHQVPQTIIDSFQRIMLFREGTDSCMAINIIAAMASFDYLKIREDIFSCGNDLTKIQNVLRTLSLEANAVALNGTFANLFQVMTYCSEKSKGDSNLLNKHIEKMVIDFYKEVMFGYRPIEIDDNPTETTLTMLKLNLHLIDVHKLENLSDSELIEKIVQPFIDIYNEDPSRKCDFDDFDI